MENVFDKEKMKQGFKKEIGYIPPGVMVGEALGEEFQQLISEYHHKIWGEGVIPLKYRYFIALGTAIFDNNEERAKLEMKKAIKYGATREELLDVLNQQVWMKGAPTLVQIAPLIQYMNRLLEKMKA
jgi:4-carboxymuconolactone decarboxylase